MNFVNANTVNVFKISMDGLGNYNRSTGFITGDVTGIWENFVLSDRGRSFTIDHGRRGNHRHGFRQTSRRVHSHEGCTEVDAYTLLVVRNLEHPRTNADVTAGTTDIPTLIETATQLMDGHEVPDTGRIIFMSELCYNALEQKISRRLPMRAW